MIKSITNLQTTIYRVENFLIGLSIVLIAMCDYLVGMQFSLGPLYLIPLSYSAITNGIKKTLILLVACIVLRQLSGPIQNLEFPFESFVIDVLIASTFIISTFFLQKLGKERTLFFDIAKNQRDELNHEIELAADVQRNLIKLNDKTPAQIDIHANTTQLKTVGGDFYDYFMISPTTMSIAIADISGKGVPAALLMPAVKLAIRAIAPNSSSPEQVLKHVNAHLFELTEARHYVTLVMVFINLEKNQITYVNAGHPPPILINNEGKAVSLDKGGLPAGILPDSVYESGKINFSEEDTLIMYSDGITEARDTNRHEYGFDRIKTLAAGHNTTYSAGLVSAIENDVSEFIGSEELTDDKTIIVVKHRANDL